MLSLPAIELPKAAQEGLQKYQDSVDRATDFATQVTLAKEKFSSVNKPSNPTFGVVRECLLRMCGGHGRCCYCELSQPDEVEHIRPKDLYPELTFKWTNYLYACGICNGTWKNKNFAVIDAHGLLRHVTRDKKSPVSPPEPGTPALLSPRIEDPFQYLELDIVDTFLFLPRATTGTTEYLRAEYSIELLGLNKRAILPKARANAFGAFRARLIEFQREKTAGVTEDVLERLKKDLLSSPHPFVWKEMQRQYLVREDLRLLFTAIPEALTWAISI